MSAGTEVVAGSLRAMTRTMIAFAHRTTADWKSGAVSIPFALALTSLLATIGGSVDVLRARDARWCAQKALDASLLYTAASSSQARLAEGSALYKANCKLINGGDAAFVVNSDGSVSGRADFSIDTVFLRLFNIKTIQLTAQGAAFATRSDSAVVQFKPKSASGWYAKDIYAFIRDASGTIVQSTKVLTYDYDYKSGKSTTVPALNASTATYTLSGGQSFGIMMRVWPNTKSIGSRKGSYVDYFSDDPAPMVKTSGQCATGKTFNWEDGGDDTYQDFVYVMTCTSMVGEAVAVRLVE